MEFSYNRRIRFYDSLATRLITVGGLMIIFCVVAILVMILKEALPLFQAPTAQVAARFRIPLQEGERVLCVGVDSSVRRAYAISSQGRLWDVDFTRPSPGEIAAWHANASKRAVVHVDTHGDGRHGITWDDGSATLLGVSYETETGNASGPLKQAVRVLCEAEAQAVDGHAARIVLLRQSDEGSVTVVRLFGENRLAVAKRTVSVDIFGEETVEEAAGAIEGEIPGRVTALAMSHDGSELYLGTSEGYLQRWALGEDASVQRLDNVLAAQGRRAISALAPVFGDDALAAGDEAGGVTVWLPVQEPSVQGKKLRPVHTLSRHEGAVRQLLPTQRTKMILSLGEDGLLAFDQTTIEKNWLNLRAISPLQTAGLSAKMNAAVGVDAAGEGVVWALHIPHPEAGWSALFGKVWYEGYDKPEYVWQSSSGHDSYEPKLSLVPLIWGSLKGTFYAMIFAVPLALLAAIYTSHFTSHAFRSWIKPTIEIMAAVPSVVIGFLAALWLAPLVNMHLLGVFFSLGFIPPAIVVSVLFWGMVRGTRLGRRFSKGYEFALFIPLLLLTLWVSAKAGGWVEDGFFRGDFKQWMFETWHVRYDIRNCIVISFALGFAVIPIVFTIAEDALSSVPYHLTAASLSLGASRWQTLWRVVLPTASPGIFAAIIVGFGRAVGETMIVLMATGNTPIMDVSAFNGMRTLSANIAVEIPEAPHEGTLYRVLFVSAVALFVFTSVLNTVAEVVRHKLRRKYGQV